MPGELLFEARGFAGGEAGEFCLDPADFTGHGHGLEGGLVGGEFGLLGSAEDPGVEESLVGGAGLVVAACPAA